MNYKLFYLLFFVLMITVPVIAQGDVTGSEDHPLITRYPGSIIEWYDVQEFDRYKIATGNVTSYRHIDDWLEVEGKVTRIFYNLSGTRSVSEVYFNYEKALKKNGFEILSEGLFKGRNIVKEVGGRNWLGVYFIENTVPPDVGLLDGSSTTGGSGFIAGKLTKNNAVVYSAISLAQYSDEKIYYMIDIIEEVAVEDDFITVDADAMLKGIKATGKIAIYGIRFDFDKATIKPESEETFQEIVKMLNAAPSLNLYVVGHTDMKGKLDYNVELSKRRAAAVVKELITNYGIKSSRLTPDGVGPLVPVATNETDGGRKQNRRVELVAK